MDARGCVAVVTGGASGLGLATVRELVENGAIAVAVDLDSPGAHDWAAQAGATFEPADVTDAAQLKRAIDIASTLGPLRILVTCAGVTDGGRAVSRTGPLALESFERVIAINLTGTFNAIRLAAAHMQAADPVDDERGVIVTTSSIAAFDGQIGQPAYAASKAGVSGMTLPLAREFAAARIRVVSIAPGVFETPMVSGMPEKAKDSLLALSLHPARLGRPQEFAALVRHIVENPMLNGETIRLDGAVRLAPR